MQDGGGGAATTSTGQGGDAGGLFTGGGGANPVCEGACVPSAGGPFVRITMVSIDTPGEVRDCPAWAPSVGFEGYAGMSAAPHTCPACECGPAACALPEEMHASAAKCADAEAAASLPWNAPPAWEGGCSAERPIAAGQQCEGAPCVQSLTIEAPAVEPCKPSQQGVASFPPPAWELMARECKINVDDDGGGCDHGTACAPVPPEGFVLCLSVAGDNPGYECPADYPEPFVFHDGIADSRMCSPCACGDPEGAECAAYVSVFTDAACSAIVGSLTVVNDEGACLDVPSGSALGSKSAHLVVDVPGKCTPTGGAPAGKVEPAGALTLCCQKVTPEPPN